MVGAFVGAVILTALIGFICLRRRRARSEPSSSGYPNNPKLEGMEPYIVKGRPVGLKFAQWVWL